MGREHVATLTDVVNGAAGGRIRAGETMIFDSTGTTLQGVACAVAAYERASAAGDQLPSIVLTK